MRTSWDADSMWMVACAAQAPSGHNAQPWIFTIQKGEIVIRPDFAKRLPVVDRNDRELFISLGCATENLCIAASQRQYLAEPMVAGDGTIAIRINRSETVLADQLFESLPQRQTNRSLYSGQAIPEHLLSGILQEFKKENAHFIHVWPRTSKAFEALTHYVMEGNTVQMNDASFKAELLSWMRFNKKHAERTGNGLSYAVMGVPSVPGWLARPIMKVMLNGKRQNVADLRKIRSSSHLVLLASRENNMMAWIATGRVLQRFVLRLTQAGIAHAYLNQPCEIPSLSSRLRAEWLGNAAFAQIFLRIGYSQPLPQSLRQPVQEVIRAGV